MIDLLLGFALAFLVNISRDDTGTVSGTIAYLIFIIMCVRFIVKFFNWLEKRKEAQWERIRINRR